MRERLWLSSCRLLSSWFLSLLGRGAVFLCGGDWWCVSSGSPAACAFCGPGQNVGGANAPLSKTSRGGGATGGRFPPSARRTKLRNRLRYEGRTERFPDFSQCIILLIWFQKYEKYTVLPLHAVSDYIIAFNGFILNKNNKQDSWVKFACLSKAVCKTRYPWGLKVWCCSEDVEAVSTFFKCQEKHCRDICNKQVANNKKTFVSLCHLWKRLQRLCIFAVPGWKPVLNILRPHNSSFSQIIGTNLGDTFLIVIL